MRPITFENTCPGHATGIPGLFFTQAVGTLLAAQCAIGRAEDYPKDYGDKLKNEDEFDFIVVGAGSAGSVVAGRLSENERWKVLLLEAGGDPNFLSDIPAMSLSLRGLDLDWGYSSEPNDKSCLAMTDGKCSYPRGKVLGGTSTINAMLYVRGNAEDYNDWEKMGNRDWGHEKVLEYFKKSEKLHNDFKLINDSDYYKSIPRLMKRDRDVEEKIYEYSKMFDARYHSKDGMLSVDHFSYDYWFQTLRNLYCKALDDLGLSCVPDVNAGNQLGFTQALGTLHGGTRGNTAKLFLNPVKKRSNLFVVKNALVQRLVMDGKKVKGVEFVRKNETKVVYAKKEVIVSAGAINSPQLLMLSGIGPKAHLESVEIPVVHELPGVGRNLQDHPAFFGAPIAVEKSTSEQITNLQMVDSIYEYLTRGTGLFGNIGLTDFIGFVNTKNDGPRPDIQFHHTLMPRRDNFLLTNFWHANRAPTKVADQYITYNEDSHILTIAPTLVRPKSRGWIELNSTHPNAAPKIFANLLDEQEDVDTLLAGIKLAQRITESEHFQSLEPEWLRIKLPECLPLEFKSDEYWECQLRHLAISLYHPAGTCKMGPETDPSAVVDDRLRVHGITNLRVADASIMPLIVSGNINAATVMIGEKVSDMIKEDWKDRETPPTHTEL